MALNTNKKGLGRGLSSLMGDTDNVQSTASTSSSETTISIAKLRPSPFSQEGSLIKTVLMNLLNQSNQKDWFNQFL